MSVERVAGGGKRWRVRWRDNAGRARSQRVDTKRQAEYLDGEIRRRKALGELYDLEQGRQTLEQFVTETWWPTYAIPQLARSTRGTQAGQWNRNIAPVLGATELRDIDARGVDELRAHMDRRGLAPLTQRSVLITLQAILTKAVEWGHLPANPVQGLRKPPRRRQRAVHPLPPSAVEAIRQVLDERSATIVSIMAYAGLRPVELRKLRWLHVRARTLWLPEDVSKNGVARTVNLFGPLGSDLAAWRNGDGDTDYVFPSTWGGGWSESAYSMWHMRDYAPAAEAAGHPGRAYDLRHSFVSLLIQAGYQILDVARQAGHRPEETLRTYGHLFEELDPSDPINPEALIEAARS